MTHGSLFSGIGGFDLAAQWMGWENVFQVEWDKWCQKVLAKNFPDSLRFGDIVEFNKMLEDGKIITDSESNGRKINRDEKQVLENNNRQKRDEKNIKERSELGCISGRHGYNRSDFDDRINIGIDILTGGFPCQPFSHAGKRKGTDDSRYLWPEMLTTIRILKPSFVVGENVAGLVSMDNGKTLDAILADLEDEGYQVESFIIPACAIGAWHRRDRIWIVAHSLNSTDRTNRGQGRKTESIPFECGQTGLSREFSGASSEILADTNNGRFKEQRLNKSIQSDIERETESIESEYASCSNGREFKTRTGQFKSGLGRMADGLPYWLHEPDGIPRVATGIKNRVDRLKGLGNAIVPQVAFQIFKAIEAFVENNTYR